MGFAIRAITTDLALMDSCDNLQLMVLLLHWLLLYGDGDSKAAMKIAGIIYVNFSTGKDSPVTSQLSDKRQQTSYEF